MSKILILAETGFGKTSSIGPITKEDFEGAGIQHTEIKGINPKETFIITVNTKGLPIPNWRRLYPPSEEQATKGNLALGVIPDAAGKIITAAGKRDDINNIILDDTNYIMQDYFMSKAQTGGFDVFKKIGAMMSSVFIAMDGVPATKNFIMMAHHEEYRNSNMDTISTRFKTVGKMVQDYITPEGKFEVVLYGKQFLQPVQGGSPILRKVFVTNYDGQYPAKSPVGMFKTLQIPNDLGYVVAAINAYNNGETLTLADYYGEQEVTE